MNESAPPDTIGYLILGLFVAATIITLFVLSMVARYRSLQQDIKMIEQLGDEDLAVTSNPTAVQSVHQ